MRPYVGMRLKAFNRHTFGVVKDCTIVTITDTHVFLSFHGIIEKYPRDKKEWFIVNGQFVTLEVL